MKKLKFLFIALMSFFAFSLNAFAASCNLSVSSTSVYVGDTFTVYANVNQAAAWNIHVVSSGSVSGCTINQANVTDDAMNTNKSFSATCTATATGTITIRLSGDVTSVNPEKTINVSDAKTVNVTTRPVSNSSSNTSSNSNTSSGTSSNTNTKTNTTSSSNSNSETTVDTKSKNNNLSSLSIDGFEVVKVDNNNYKLTVNNDISNINISATAEDSKATVTGSGKHELNVGENTIEVVITAENGTQNKINIVVTRKDGYDLDDLEYIIKNDIESANIKINSDTIITSEMLNQIKSSEKIITFSNFDDNNLITYSWIIDGAKIDSETDLNTAISFDSKYKKIMLELSNYADGLYISNNSKTLKYTTIKLYVGNKFDNDDLVNIYKYTKGNKKLELVKSDIKVEDGYIEIDSEGLKDYLITKSTITSIDNCQNDNEQSSLNVVEIIVTIIITLIILLGIVFIIMKKHHIKISDLKNILKNSNNI